MEVHLKIPAAVADIQLMFSSVIISTKNHYQDLGLLKSKAKAWFGWHIIIILAATDQQTNTQLNLKSCQVTAKNNRKLFFVTGAIHCEN